MIKINLLKGGKPAKGARLGGAGDAFDKKKLFIAFPVLIVLIGLVVMLTLPANKEVKVAQPKEVLAKVDSPPGRYLDIVEETVEELSERSLPISTKGVLSLSYRDMSIEEKIIYGSNFLQRVINTINKNSTKSIEINTIGIVGFSGFSALGLAASRRHFNQFINRLKGMPECSDLAITYTGPSRENPGKMKFIIKGSFKFGLNYADLSRGNGLNAIPGHSELLHSLKQFKELGKQHDIKWRKIQRKKMEKEGIYRKHVVEIAGASNYKKSVAFLNSLLSQDYKVCFNRWLYKASGKNKVNLRTEAFFYTKPD